MDVVSEFDAAIGFLTRYYREVWDFDGESCSHFFGMSDDEVVSKCRAKVAGFLGEEKAKEFDSIT